MKLGLVTVCGVLLLTGLAHAQDAATNPAPRQATKKQPPAAASRPASVPASQPAVDENQLVEIDVKDLPVIVALRTIRLLKNVDQFTLSIACFSDTQNPHTRDREAAVFSVAAVADAKPDQPAGDPDDVMEIHVADASEPTVVRRNERPEAQGEQLKRDRQGRIVATITRRTASLIVRQLLWDGFIERAENLRRQKPSLPDTGYILVVTGIDTTDLYEVLPYNAATLERLKELRKLLDRTDQKSTAAFDKATQKIANDENLEP